MFKIKIKLFILCVILSCCKEVLPNSIRAGYHAQDKINRTGKLKNLKGRWDNKSNPRVDSLIIVRPCNTSYIQARLDFKNLVLDAPAASSVCVENQITFSGQGSPQTFSLCGNLTGQHVYLNFEDSEDILISIGDPENIDWDIEIIQLRPTDLLYAPDNCLQYYLTGTGTVESFNYATTTTITQQIASLDYNICITTQKTLCTITYTAIGPFSITTDLANPGISPPLTGDVDCTTDYLEIGFDTVYTDEDGNPINADSRFCGETGIGTQFVNSNGVTTATLFQIRVVTDANENNDVLNLGFRFSYATSTTC